MTGCLAPGNSMRSLRDMPNSYQQAPMVSIVSDTCRKTHRGASFALRPLSLCFLAIRILNHIVAGTLRQDGIGRILRPVYAVGRGGVSDLKGGEIRPVVAVSADAPRLVIHVENLTHRQHGHRSQGTRLPLALHARSLRVGGLWPAVANPPHRPRSYHDSQPSYSAYPPLNPLYTPCNPLLLK